MTAESIRGKSKFVKAADAWKLMDIARELLPGHHLDLWLSGEGTDRGKAPYLVASREPLSLEEFERFKTEDPKVYTFDYRQLRLPPEMLKKEFKELLKLPEILPP